MNKEQLAKALSWQIEQGVTDNFSDVIKVNAAEKPLDIRGNAEKVLDSVNYQQKINPQENNKQSRENPQAQEPQKENNIKTQTSNQHNVITGFNSWVEAAKQIANRVGSIDELRQEVENFDGLSIKKTATNCVFGEGNPKADIMLIGEAPGANEDIEGIPFCGVSGQLMDKMFSYAGYTRKENLYITNTIFWRPPGNRKPTQEETEICKPLVERHISLIDPKAIVLVGGTATSVVLNDKTSVSKLRMLQHKYFNSFLNKDIPTFAIYHPSFLLRQPIQKKNSWFDILKIKKFVESL